MSRNTMIIAAAALSLVKSLVAGDTRNQWSPRAESTLRAVRPGEDPVEGKSRYSGCRLYLKKLREDDDPERIDKLRRQRYGDERDGRFLVIFSVEKELPLVGAGNESAV